MLQKLIEFGKQLFTVIQNQQKQADEIKNVREDATVLQQDLNSLRKEVSDLSRL